MSEGSGEKASVLYRLENLALIWKDSAVENIPSQKFVITVIIWLGISLEKKNEMLSSIDDKPCSLFPLPSSALDNEKKLIKIKTIAINFLNFLWIAIWLNPIINGMRTDERECNDSNII